MNGRALTILAALQTQLTTCIKRLFHSKQDVRQTYDFFSNPKVSRTALLEPHFTNTARRVQASDANYILAIQDGTVLNYSSHKAKTELGRISHAGKTHQYGLIQHSTLCITDKNECLGLIDLQHFHHDDFDKSINHNYRSKEDKKTMCWISALKSMRARLPANNKEIITVADREGDFFEFLYALDKESEFFVIRAKHDRYSGKEYQEGDKLSELLKKQDILGETTISINDVNTREIKKIQLKIKRLNQIEIPVPYWAGWKDKKQHYRPIRVNVVMAYNENYSWILLTNLPADDLLACQKVIKIYKERWHIEDYHKILKTGYQIDEIYLHSSRQAIENALTMASISACRLYWMIYVGRVSDTISADCIFKDYEWKCLYIYFKEPIPNEVPPLSDIILRIAKLGGYKHRKDAKPPGVKIMWLGLRGLTFAAEMYKNILSTKT